MRNLNLITLGSERVNQMRDDYANNSHYLTYTFLLKGDGRMCLLSLGAKGLLNPFAPKSDQFQVSPAASPEILHHTV